MRILTPAKSKVVKAVVVAGVGAQEDTTTVVASGTRCVLKAFSVDFIGLYDNDKDNGECTFQDGAGDDDLFVVRVNRGVGFLFGAIEPVGLIDVPGMGMLFESGMQLKSEWIAAGVADRESGILVQVFYTV